MCVKIGDQFEILSYLQTNELTCHCFRETGRRLDFQVKEKGASYYLSSHSRVIFILLWFSEPEIPQGNTMRAQWLLHTPYTTV